jgi:E3 ubiquitin-protein ligase UBR7
VVRVFLTATPLDTMASSSIVTLMDDLDNQNLLIQAAASAIPHQFDKCTYQLGYLRQSVSLCLDCKEERGLCGGCSVSCHGDHQQIELFPKRNFRCDCPTRAMHHPCELNGAPKAIGNDKLEVNDFNQYNQNYVDGGRFCRCHSHYDGMQEQETMVQCLACEDWCVCIGLYFSAH